MRLRTPWPFDLFPLLARVQLRPIPWRWFSGGIAVGLAIGAGIGLQIW